MSWALPPWVGDGTVPTATPRRDRAVSAATPGGDRAVPASPAGGDRAVPAATLSHELAAGAAELRALRDRVQRLQNELIRVRPRGHGGHPGLSRGSGPCPALLGLLPQKNDREKELVLLQRRQWQQKQLALRRCQDRAAEAGALQRALRQQDKVTRPG